MTTDETQKTDKTDKPEKAPPPEHELPWAVVGSAGFDDLVRGATMLGWTVARGEKKSASRTAQFENGWLAMGAPLHEARVLARALANVLDQRVQLVEWARGPRGKVKAQGRGVDARGVWASERYDWVTSNLAKVTLPAPPDLADRPEQYQAGMVSLSLGDEWCPDRGGAHGPAVHMSGPGVSDGATLDRSAAHYIRWRLMVLGHAATGTGPDLSRWVQRAMRRARLDAVPRRGDAGWEAYLTEWRTYTAKERAAGPGHSHLVAAWKFGPGEWVFDGDELQVMRRALPNQPLDHEPNAWQAQAWQDFEQLLEVVGDRLEFRVPE